MAVLIGFLGAMAVAIRLYSTNVLSAGDFSMLLAEIFGFGGLITAEVSSFFWHGGPESVRSTSWQSGTHSRSGTTMRRSL